MAFPYPRGCSSDTGFFALRRPTRSSNWFAQSAKEWIASASIAPEPVYQAAAPFEIAIPPFAPNAYMIAFMDPSVCDMGDIVTETRFRSEPDRVLGDPSFIRVVEYENMNRL